MYLKDKGYFLRVRISKEQFEKLGELADASGFSVSDIVRQMLDRL